MPFLGASLAIGGLPVCEGPLPRRQTVGPPEELDPTAGGGMIRKWIIPPWLLQPRRNTGELAQLQYTQGTPM